MTTKTDEKFILSIQQDRRIFRALSKKMSVAERLWVLGCEGRYEVYQSRLRELAAHHGIKVKDLQED